MVTPSITLNTYSNADGLAYIRATDSPKFGDGDHVTLMTGDGSGSYKEFSDSITLIGDSVTLTY